jgi:hypothetical protein
MGLLTLPLFAFFNLERVREILTRTIACRGVDHFSASLPYSGLATDAESLFSAFRVFGEFRAIFYDSPDAAAPFSHFKICGEWRDLLADFVPSRHCSLDSLF